MGAGGAPHRRLDAIRELYPLSLHGVGLSIGSPGPLDRAHLQRLAAVAKRFEPTLVSEHLAWSTHEGAFLNDLLPLPYTDETFARVSEHIDEVQNALGRTMLLENPSTYVVFAESTWAETDFLREIARRTGCGLLLDVNNVFVSAVNHGFDPEPLSRRFSAFERSAKSISRATPKTRDDAGLPLLIDAHNSPVRDAVWSLYAATIRRLGPDADADRMGQRRARWPTLLDEARRAERAIVETASNSRARRCRLRRRSALSRRRLTILRPLRRAMTRGRMGAPDARRFAVYRNNVAVGLIGALEARYPVSRRIAGEDLFRAMARAFVRAHKPRSPVMIAYGGEFPEFMADYLADGSGPEDAQECEPSLARRPKADAAIQGS